MAEPTASAQVEIAAPAEDVYALVTDLPGMGRLAEENQGGSWLRGADSAAVGAKFRGHNRRGPLHWWTTVTVTDADPGRRFGFDVHSLGLPIAHWEYAIEPTEDGCRVTESTWDRRPGWFKPIGGFATASMNRAMINQHNIERTLARLKATAEV
jgi:hypothetical protein